jgi:DNA-binding NarL/FixJ family response regulator
LHTVRAGLGMLLSTPGDAEVLVEEGSADEAMGSLRRLRRRSGVVALVALGLRGDHDSFWLIRELRDVYPSFAILAFSSRAEQVSISRALFAGADGFVHKNSPPSEFLAAVHAASRGELVMHGLEEGSLGAIVVGIDDQIGSERILTVRERQILTVATEGLTARQIGTRLGVRERTVTTHLAHIYKKLGVSGRVSAIAVASRTGLVTAGYG